MVVKGRSIPSRPTESDSKWPKRPPELTDEQRRIQDDWTRYFTKTLPQSHGRIDRFNHTYAARSECPGRTLEIGAGLGNHIGHESLSQQEYHAVELRDEMAQVIKREFPSVHTVVADCQDRLPYEDSYFDRVLAIHVLEHLPDLPAALNEVKRVLRPGGRLVSVIPCEGGWIYNLGRRLTVKRAFERRYNTVYDWHITSDHLNAPGEIFEEARALFRIEGAEYFPCRVPTVHLNAVIGFTAVRPPDSAGEPILPGR